MTQTPSPYPALDRLAERINDFATQVSNPAVTNAHVEFIAEDADAGTTFWQIVGHDTDLDMDYQLISPRERENVLHSRYSEAELNSIASKIVSPLDRMVTVPWTNYLT